MSRVRKQSIVAKPLVDELTILRFAAAGAAGESGGVAEQSLAPADHQAVVVNLKRDILAALEKDAARKGRTVAEQISKILAKYYA